MTSFPRTAFITTTPVLTGIHVPPSAASSFSKNSSVATVCARAELPEVNRVNKGASSDVWTAISNRVKEDTTLLLNSARREVPSTSCLAAFCAAAILACSTGVELPRAYAEVPSTVPSTSLYDDASVVPRPSVQSFSKSTDAILSRTGFRVRFVLVRGLPFGSSPYDYAQQLASDWNLGDHDILFVASVKLARAGVYVGDAARPLLSEDVAKSIAEETFGIPAGDERYSAAILGVSNRLIPVLNGEADPGPPSVASGEVVQNYKTKAETKGDRDKYIKVVGGVLVIAIVAPLIQTYWYVRDD